MRKAGNKTALIIYQSLNHVPRWKGSLAVFLLLLVLAWLIALAGLYSASPAAPRGDGFYLFSLFSGTAVDLVLPGGEVQSSVQPGIIALVEGFFWAALCCLLLAALFNAFRRPFMCWLVGAIQGHVLVWGTGAATLEAQRVNAVSKTPSLGLLPDRDLGLQQELDQLSLPWRSARKSDAILKKTLACPAASIFATDESDTANIALVERLCHHLERHAAAPGVSLIVRISDGQLRRRLSRRFLGRNELKKIRVVIFSDHDLRARLAARIAPAFHFCHASQPDLAHLAIVGQGYPAEIMLVQLLKVMHFPRGKRVIFSVIDKNALNLKAEFESRFPELAANHPIFYHTLETSSSTEWATWLLNQAEAGKRPTAWYFIHEDNSGELKRALALEDAYAVLGEVTPPMVLLSSEAADGGVLKDSPMLRAVGDVTRVQDGELVSQHRLDAMAATIQQGYLEECLAGGEQLGDRESLHRWADLSENFKEENRDQAEHNLIKLSLLSLSPSYSDPQEPLDIPGEVLEALSVAEHDRWLASRQARGWIYAKERNDARRRHPDMVSWQALPEPRREIDRIMIRQIPHLLKSMNQFVRKRVYCLFLVDEGVSETAVRSVLQKNLAELDDTCSPQLPVLVGNPADPLTQAVFNELRAIGPAEFVALLAGPSEARPDPASSALANNKLRNLLQQARGVLACADRNSPEELSRLIPDFSQQWLVFHLRTDGSCNTEMKFFGSQAGHGVDE